MNITTVAQKASTKEPAYLSPEWLYDVLMETIEPDLMNDTIGTLEEKYKHETPAQRVIRMERYAAAFYIYQESLDDLDLYLQDEMKTMVQEMSRAAHDADISDVLSTMKTFDSLDSNS